jgi:hypothetical protein
MTEPELRAVVREAIARYASEHSPAPDPPVGVGRRLSQQHPSHGMFVLPVGSDADGPCLIEPAVMCNHCGYCKSYGH